MSVLITDWPNFGDSSFTKFIYKRNAETKQKKTQCNKRCKI